MWRRLTRSNTSIVPLLAAWAGLLIFLTERGRWDGFRGVLGQEGSVLGQEDGVLGQESGVLGQASGAYGREQSLAADQSGSSLTHSDVSSGSSASLGSSSESGNNTTSNTSSTLSSPAAANSSAGKSTPAPIPAQRSPEELATRILHIALHQSVWGPPAKCEVRQQIHLYGKEINCFGRFIRAGQGSGKLNLKMEFPAADTMNRLLQISDGQRLQTVENLSGQRKRTIIDLVKVRDGLVINSQSLYDPTIAMYLAIGGQAESLRKLCQQYEWYAVRSSKYDDKSVWLLSGRLATNPPQVRAIAPTDLRLQAEVQSGLLPTEVRVAIGKIGPDEALPYWLYQVEHRRQAIQNGAGEGDSLRLITEWARPQPVELSQIEGAAYFELATTNEPLFEETDDYQPPAQLPFAGNPSHKDNDQAILNALLKTSELH